MPVNALKMVQNISVNASSMLNPIIFADDTNLFFTHKYIRYLFQIVNQELEKNNQWFISNKLSLNMFLKKYRFFHKLNQKEKIPLLLPKLIIQRTESINFWEFYWTKT